MVPLIALASVLLIAATALAVDLSVQTNKRRDLQNVTDSAALAGARDLYSSNGTLGKSDQSNAVVNALSTIQTNMQWTSLPNNWPQQQESSNGVGCTNASTECDVSITGLGISGSTFSITVNTPPTSGAHKNDTHYLDVQMHQTSSNYFAGVIGRGSDTQGAQSTAFHLPGQVPFGFALYSNTFVASGNAAEFVKGFVYANRFIQPQASGQAGFCAENSSTTADDGYALFGSPQKGDSSYNAKTDPGQADTSDPKASPVSWFLLCNTTNTANGVVNQTGALVNPANATLLCPATVSGVTASALSFNTQIAACVANPPIQPPAEDPPPNPSSWTWVPTSTITKNGVSFKTPADLGPPGVYVVQHFCTSNSGACDDITFAPTDKTGPADFAGYTFVLEGPSGSADNGGHIAFAGGLKTGAANVLTPYDGGTGLPTDGKYAVYAPSGSTGELDITNQDGDNSASLEITKGTIYMPAGTVSATNNGSIRIDAGQAIVGTWDVQSGNHPNPEITYDGGSVSPVKEFLGLVK